MRLYHGSSKVIETPVYGEGNPQNDYGLGFYCTENLELAKEWACPRENDGFANQYELKDEKPSQNGKAGVNGEEAEDRSGDVRSLLAVMAVFTQQP